MKKKEHPNRWIAPASLKTITILCAIMLVGCGVRLAALYEVATYNNNRTSMDAVDYSELGANILDHATFVTWTAGFKASSTRPPLYPLAIASTYTIFGNRNYLPLLFLNVFFDMISLVLVFLVARALSGNLAGLGSAGIYAVFGHAVYYASMIGPYTISVTLLLALIFSVLSFKNNYWGTLPAFVVIFAALIHIRPVFLLVAPFVFFVVYFQIIREANTQLLDRCFGKRIWKSALPIFLVAILCVPWGVRNFGKHHALIPVCTISGWHLGGVSELDMRLPLDALMENIYDPRHKGFSEADYFLLARSKFFHSLWEHPFLIPAFGVARIAIGWSPPTPWRRFFLPKAYVFPLRLGGIIIPLIDFEGLLYLSVFGLLFFVALLRRRALGILGDVLKSTYPLTALVVAYGVAHIIGFPRISYRFIIEPPLIVLGVIIMLRLAVMAVKAYRKRSDLVVDTILSPSAPGLRELVVVNTVAGIAILFTVLPLIGQGVPKTFQYPSIHSSAEEKTYSELRAIQWRHMGDIPKGTRAMVAGIVKYLNPGFKHVAGAIEPVKDKSFVAGRLFVQFGDPKHPLGTGDVKVNFKRGCVPKEGSAVVVRGAVLVGAFKWIIINVNEFSTIPPMER